MKKSLVVASLLFIGSSALVAADIDNSWFVGGEFGAQNMKIKSTVTVLGVTDSEKDTMKATYEAIKIGKNFEFGRLYGSLGKQNEKDDFLFKFKSNFSKEKKEFFIGKRIFNNSYSSSC